jgi:hypothetical protein
MRGCWLLTPDAWHRARRPRHHFPDLQRPLSPAILHFPMLTMLVIDIRGSRATRHDTTRTWAWPGTPQAAQWYYACCGPAMERWGWRRG